MDLTDRVVGSALGLALGDALGAPFEFLRARNVPDPIPALERPWLGEPPGSTTDDTAMARNLMRSLAARGGLDPADVLERHLEWFRSDPPDVGTLTGRVLRRIAGGEDPAAAAQSIWDERGPEVSAGNGSVMYCPPLGIAYANRPERLLELAPALSDRRRGPGGRGGARVPGRGRRRVASDRRARSGLLPVHGRRRVPGARPPGRRRDGAAARRLARRRHRHERRRGRLAARRPQRRWRPSPRLARAPPGRRRDPNRGRGTRPTRTHPVTRPTLATILGKPTELRLLLRVPPELLSHRRQDLVREVGLAP